MLPPLSPVQLGNLAAKYQALLALRASRDQTGGEEVRAETKAVMRQLSQAFPGCLRELDLLTRDQLAKRLDAATLAASGHATAPWLAWMSRYHELLRLALAAKQGSTSDAPANLAAFLKQCADPPGGRLVPLVLTQLASEAEVSIDLLAHELFPKRR